MFTGCVSIGYHRRKIIEQKKKDEEKVLLYARQVKRREITIDDFIFLLRTESLENEIIDFDKRERM